MNRSITIGALSMTVAWLVVGIGVALGAAVFERIDSRIALDVGAVQVSWLLPIAAAHLLQAAASIAVSRSWIGRALFSIVSKYLDKSVDLSPTSVGTAPVLSPASAMA